MTESTNQSFEFPHPQSVSLELLQSLNACNKGIDEYKSVLLKSDVYPKLSQIAENIRLNHLLWILCKIDIKKQFSRVLACDFAEHVLHIYENKYPEDMRPRKAIESCRLTTTIPAAAADAYADADAAADAYAAADAAAADAAADNYADAAADAAVDAAAAAAAAADAYADADADANAYAAADATAVTAAAAAYAHAYDNKTDAYAARQVERDWQKSHLISLLIQYENGTIDWNRKTLAEFYA